MAVRRIDQELLVTEDGSFVFRAGGRAYLVPDSDIHRLDRRGTALKVAAAALLVGCFVAFWAQLVSVWWLMPMLALIAAAPLVLRRWVQEHFTEISDPAIIADVDLVPRRLALFAPASFLLVAVQIVFDRLHVHSAAITIGLLLLTCAVTGIEAAQSRRARDDREEQKQSESASITR
jgi:hypothetical protein